MRILDITLLQNKKILFSIYHLTHRCYIWAFALFFILKRRWKMSWAKRPRITKVEKGGPQLKTVFFREITLNNRRFKLFQDKRVLLTRMYKLDLITDLVNAAFEDYVQLDFPRIKQDKSRNGNVY